MEHSNGHHRHPKHKLKAKAIELMDFLADGNQHENKQVADGLGMKMNSTFANLKTSLKKVGVIKFDGKQMWMTDDMFPFGRGAE